MSIVLSVFCIVSFSTGIMHYIITMSCKTIIIFIEKLMSL